MTEYRLYTIEKSGRAAGPQIVISCIDEDDALIQAHKQFDGRAMEIWRNDRKFTFVPAD